jgi:hypothetical protein
MFGKYQHFLYSKEEKNLGRDNNSLHLQRALAGYKIFSFPLFYLILKTTL